MDETYTTQPIHNNPMEPHASLAVWDGGDLTLYDSIQGTWLARDAHRRAVRARARARAGDLPPRRRRLRLEGHAAAAGRPRRDRRADRRAPGQGRPHPAAALLHGRLPHADDPARAARRRRATAGCGRSATTPSSRPRPCASSPSRPPSPRATCTRRPTGCTTHRLVALDVPTPSWMRAPGECPGMFALESAMDELAIACGIDPIELRIANEPPEDPEKGIPFSSRNLVACLREGARALRLGGARPDPRRAPRRPLARRHRRRRVDLPGLPLALAGDRAARRRRRLHGPDRRHGHRHRRAHGADPDRRRRARRRPRAGADGDRRQRLRAGRASRAARWAPRRGARPS